MPEQLPNGNYSIFTVGHSNHRLETLLNLLEQHQIDVVADVRSNPYSQYTKHFNKEVIKEALQIKGVRYLFLGDALGGKPGNQEFIDADGYVLYSRLAKSPKFQKGISQLLRAIKTCQVTLLCAEEDPTNCHRRLLVSRVLDEFGVNVMHIRGDGRIQSEEQVAKEERFRKTKGQTSLFDLEEKKEWKSTQSVLQRRPQESSSEFSSEQGSSD